MAAEEVLLSTSRLRLTPWAAADAPAALEIFGRPEVARWLTPAVEPIHSEADMRTALEQWATDDAVADTPVGHWAVRRRDDDAVVGSITLRRMPPHHEDLELAWQFTPEHWGHGYATEAARAVAAWAFGNSARELFAVMRPANERAKKLARRLGMQWVGETDKYYDLRLQVFRLQPSELVVPAEG
ncbi:GNAT family N-acetyltransferase [Nocardia sp. NPDC051570]|uniref:GNAT family N-acetyltransferase n=1 Tax=Nocardia sp. NPDC051570 TaxID=3364324 RepID=UPI0037ABA5CE